MWPCWSQWVDILTVTGAIATFVGVCILAYEIYLRRREFKRDAVASLFADLITPPFRKALRFIYRHNPADLTLESLSEKDRDDVEMVLAQLDGVGFRLEERLVPDEETYKLFSAVVLRTAQRLWPHIEDQREKRGNKGYKQYYERMVRKFKRRQLSEQGRKLSERELAALSIPELLDMKPLDIFVLRPEEEDELALLRQRVAELEAELAERDAEHDED